MVEKQIALAVAAIHSMNRVKYLGIEKKYIDGNASKPHIKTFDKNEIFTEIYL